MPERVTRDDVHERWLLAIPGGASLRQAAAWAEERLDNNPDCEELVLRGLLHLQALVHQPLAPSEDVEAALRSWRGELEVYDRDPGTWTNNYFVAMLEGFAQRHGSQRAEEFAARLQANGVITDVDARRFTPRRE